MKRLTKHFLHHPSLSPTAPWETGVCEADGQSVLSTLTGDLSQSANSPAFSTERENHELDELLRWPPQSPDLNPIEHLWDVVEREIHIMDVQPTNLQQLRNAIMLILTKISEECFQHLVESMP